MGMLVFHPPGECHAQEHQVTQTCPAGSQPLTSYDSNGTTLRIYAPAAGLGNPGVMFEYTKQ